MYTRSGKLFSNVERNKVVSQSRREPVIAGKEGVIGTHNQITNDPRVDNSNDPENNERNHRERDMNRPSHQITTTYADVHVDGINPRGVDEEIVDEIDAHSVVPSVPNVVGSQVSRISIAARKRRLELQAAEERLKIRRTILAERERAEIELVNSRLRVELAELEEAEESQIERAVDTPRNVRFERGEYVQDWLNNPIEPIEQPIITPATGGRQSSTELRDLTQAITKALESVQGRNTDDQLTHRLVSRLTSSRDLPIFDGDPLDWPRFKKSFESSTERGGFTEQENATRLYHSLRKDAKDAVAALMITSTDVTQIMKALQLRFGNPDLVAQKVVKEMRRLQRMNQGRGNLVVIASTVRNGVAALQSIKHTGYLHSPELAAEILTKIPENLIHSYNQFYTSRIDQDEPRVVTLANFLGREAEIACKAGTVELSSRGQRQDWSANHSSNRRDTDYKRNESPRRRNDSDHRRSERILTTTENSSGSDRTNQHRERDSENRLQCSYCKTSRHFIDKCSRFSEQSVRKRWLWVKDAGACFKCLVIGHTRAQCTSRSCPHPGCQRPHHILLHPDTSNRAPSLNRAHEETEENGRGVNTGVTTNTWTTEEKRVLLKVIPVRLEGPQGYVDTYALLDGGSTITLVDAAIAKQIGAEGRKSALRIVGANEMESSEPNSELVGFTVYGEGIKRSHQIAGARTIQNLHLPCQSLQELDLKGHRHLDEIKTRCYSGASPKLLIGQDHWDLITPTEVRGSSRNAPVASFTKLGWVVHGHAGGADRQSFRKQKHTNCLFIKTHYEEVNFHERQISEKLDELQALVKTNFTLEGMGVTSHHRKSLEDQRAETIMAETTRRLNDQWETGLLWRHDHTTLPDSRTNAYKRLISLETKMRKDPEYAELYKRQIENFIDKGYAKKVLEADFDNTGRTWYLPHFRVTNPNKPGKLRLVFDAAAKSQGISLNDELINGPDLLCSLPGVLMKFRQRKIAFTADIREMFLQVKIRREDQNAQLFLWRGEDLSREPETYCMTSMIFGARSSPSLAQYIKNRNADESGHGADRAVHAIKERHYVDDYLDSVDDEKEAIELIKEVTAIHSRGGFELRGWNSNNHQVLTSISQEQETQEVSFTPNDHVGTRILGLKWFPSNDTLSFTLSTTKIPNNILNGTERPSKREVLRIMMSVFDPLGFLTPYTVRCKILLQKVWRKGVGWDEPLTGDLFTDWQKWVGELSEISRCLLPRCYTRITDFTSVELHVFCDASEQAMAAVAYWRFVNDKNKASVSFIMGRSRVAPLKPLSIPRMELQAAVMATRLAKVIVDEHEFDVDRRVFWTDSRIVWHWITGDARTYKSWVANRLGEIDESTIAQEWRWVPTKQNPADEGTRNGSSIPSPTSQWFQGATFLQQAETHWPSVRPNYAEDGEEERRTERVHTLSAVRDSLPLPDLSRFSSWIRLIRTTAWILLIVDKWLKKTEAELETIHLKKAQTLWIRKSQADSFRAEYDALKNGQSVPKQSRLRQLCPFIDENDVIRVQGRISAAQAIKESVKCPIILDGHHTYTRLLVLRYHQEKGHGTPETVLNEIRQKYWIVNARRTIRTVSSSCRWCRVQRAKPQIPRMGELPKTRLAHHNRPFSFSGVDYFGPMLVTIGRRREKRWGVLFTCLTTRAIHLEIAASLSTDSAILALRRFVARRGQPSELYSDNGTNFHGAASELQKAIEELDTTRLHNEAITRGISWRFIPPSAPHMGGCWERLIRCVKEALRVTLKERAPREEVLLTLLTEAEHSVNSRPLTHVSDRLDDEESLTPNHFLIGSSSGVSITGRFEDNDFSGRKQWRISQRLADIFWSRWIKEYLPTLLPRKKWNEEQKTLQEGDVVLMMEPTTPRNVWPRGVLTRLFPGSDGRIRVVEVRTRNGIVKRPVTKIIPLEVLKEGTDKAVSVPAGEDVVERMTGS